MLRSEDGAPQDRCESSLPSSANAAGRIDIAPQGFDVVECVAEIEGAFAAGSRAHSLKLRILEALPRLECDRDGFKNAACNLLSNARDAMPNGGAVAICIGAYAGGKGVEICIVDSGVGMTDETVARAFEPCFTTKTVGLGGLGLPMAEQFVRDADGQILVESLAGVGTIVRLRIPAARRAFSAAE